MTTYDFTLIVDGPDLQTDSNADALFEAGCDDSLLGSVDGVQFLDFDREADSLGEAVLSAIADIESAVPEASVVRLASGGLVSMAEIAKRTHKSREFIRLLVSGERGPGGFPAPATDPRSRYRLWVWSDVEPWMAPFIEAPIEDADLTLLGSINAGLQLRRTIPRLPESERRSLIQLTGLG